MAIWKTVIEYEGLYEVSDTGRVRSVERVVPHKKNGPTRYAAVELSQSKCGRHGYMRVRLSKEGRAKDHYIHALVAKAFVDGWFPDALVRHYDDVPTNNHWTNLRWGTALDNGADYRRNRRNRQ